MKRSKKHRKVCVMSDSDLKLPPNDSVLEVEDNLSSLDAFEDDSSKMKADSDADTGDGENLNIGAEIEVSTGLFSDTQPSGSADSASGSSGKVTIDKSDWIAFQNQNKRILKQLNSLFPDSGKKKPRQIPATVTSQTIGKRKRSVDDDDVLVVNDNPPPKRRVIFESSDDDNDVDNEFLRLAEDDQNDENCDNDNNFDNFEELNELEKIFLRNSETGPPVSARLATLIDAMATGSKCLTEEKLKEKELKYPRPENVHRLIVPKVNPELWSQLDHATKSQDLKSQRQQKLLLTAVNALVRTTETWVTHKPTDVKKKNNPNSDIFSAITDSTSIILKAVHDVSMDRRSKVLNAPTVNNKYKRLASAEIPITENLFGDNLKEAMAAIDNSSKLGSNFTKSSKGRKFFPARAKNYQAYHYQDRRRNAQWIRGRGRGGRQYQFGDPAQARQRGQQTQKRRFAGA